MPITRAREKDREKKQEKRKGTLRKASHLNVTWDEQKAWYLELFRRTRPLHRVGSNARDRVLSVAEYIRLLGESPPHFGDILIVGYSTGMRPEELYQLEWPMVDMKARMLRLPGPITKESKDKRVPINSHVKAVLDARPRHLHHDRVFSYKKKPITSRVRRSLETACGKAGIVYGKDKPNGFVFKDVRTSVKTNMARAGVDKGFRDIILGHTLEGMDQFYLKPNEEDLHRAMDTYTAWLDQEIKSADEAVMHQKGNSGNAERHNYLK